MKTHTKILSAFLSVMLAAAAFLVVTPAADAQVTDIDDIVNCSDPFWKLAPKCAAKPDGSNQPGSDAPMTVFDSFITCDALTDNFWAVYCDRFPPDPPAAPPVTIKNNRPGTPISGFVNCTDVFWRVACGGTIVDPPKPVPTFEPKAPNPMNQFVLCTDPFWKIACGGTAQPTILVELPA